MVRDLPDLVFQRDHQVLGSLHLSPLCESGCLSAEFPHGPKTTAQLQAPNADSNIQRQQRACFLCVTLVSEERFS